jgi:hypothetical protein
MAQPGAIRSSKPQESPGHQQASGKSGRGDRDQIRNKKKKERLPPLTEKGYGDLWEEIKAKISTREREAERGKRLHRCRHL